MMPAIARSSLRSACRSTAVCARRSCFWRLSFVVTSPSFCNSLRGHELLGQARERTLLDHSAFDGPVVIAAAAPKMVQAAVAVLENDAITALAAAAGQQTR